MTTQLLSPTIRSMHAFLLVFILASGCGDDGGGAAADAAPDATDPALLIPVDGDWRAQFDGTFQACELGGPTAKAIPDQALSKMFSGGDNMLFVLTHDDQPLLTCNLTEPGKYACSSEDLTVAGADGFDYKVDRTFAFEFSSTTLGTAAVNSTIKCLDSECPSSEACVDDVTYTLSPFIETEALAATSCDDEATSASSASFVETYIDFVNNTDAPVGRFWINFDGVRDGFPAIPAGETLRQRTYAGHTWILEDGECLGIFAAGDDIGVVSID